MNVENMQEKFTTSKEYVNMVEIADGLQRNIYLMCEDYEIAEEMRDLFMRSLQFAHQIGYKEGAKETIIEVQGIMQKEQVNLAASNIKHIWGIN